MLGAASPLPLALGGNALSGENTGIAVVGLLSIVAGYVLLAALWYFVFRQSPDDREGERRIGEEARDAAHGVPAPAARASASSDKLRRRPSPRFRRR